MTDTNETIYMGGDYGSKSESKHRKRKMGMSSYMVMMAFGFGLLLILLNIYQLYHLSIKTFGDSAFISSHHKKKLVWIYAKRSYALKHVIHLFSLAGYTVVTSTSPPAYWHVMWAFEYPFREELFSILVNLNSFQMVNHFPGTGFLTLKVELATSHLRWIPPAFSIPKQKNEFLLMAERSPTKLWIQKSNNHRGIQITSSKDVDLEAQGTFIQEFVDNPLLIDKKKFDIGIYVVYTSINPLMVYIYDDEVLLRFCTIDYHPLNAENTAKYVVGDDYIPWTEMPSLRNSHTQSRLSAKNALFAYLSDIGYDVNQIWAELIKCISQLSILKERPMEDAFTGYRTKENFFELVRIDFVLDDVGKIWLMEVNMSPNLSSDMHPGNALMYQQVIFHTLALVGAASYIDDDHSHDVKDINVSEMNIMLPITKCKSSECMHSCLDKCRLCNQCLTEIMKKYIKKAYREHLNRGNFRRVLPLQLRPKSGSVMDVNTNIPGTFNEILALWFQEKCKLDTSWCQ